MPGDCLLRGVGSGCRSRLCIVFLPVDACRLLVFFVVQSRTLCFGYFAIRLHSRFRRIDLCLADFEASRLAFVERAAGDTLLNARLLIGLALIDVWCIGLRRYLHGERK